MYKQGVTNMKKSFGTLLLCSLTGLLALSGCQREVEMPSEPHQVDSGVDVAVTDCREKVDLISKALDTGSAKTSQSLLDEQAPSKSKKLLDDVEKAECGPLSKVDYTKKQGFGLYILHNVYHAVNFGYDKEGVDKGLLIYDKVQNELDDKLRQMAIKNNTYSKFYMQIDQRDDDYYFEVDWLTNTQYRGDIFVSGMIYYDEGVMTGYRVNCLEQSAHGSININYYDFINEDFYFFDSSFETDNNDNINKYKEFVSSFNDGDDLESVLPNYGFDNIKIASGKITSDPKKLNFKGFYLLKSTVTDESRPLFESVMEKIKGLPMRCSDLKMKRGNPTRVHFMDRALAYGINSTRVNYVPKWGINDDPYNKGTKIVFPNIEADDFDKGCQTTLGEVSELFNKVNKRIKEQNIKDYINAYEDDEISIENSSINSRYHGYNTFVTGSTAPYYRLTDKVNNKGYDFMFVGEAICVIHNHTIPADTPIEKSVLVSSPDRLTEKVYLDYGRCPECNELVVVSKTVKEYQRADTLYNIVPGKFADDNLINAYMNTLAFYRSKIHSFDHSTGLFNENKFKEVYHTNWSSGDYNGGLIYYGGFSTFLTDYEAGESNRISPVETSVHVSTGSYGYRNANKYKVVGNNEETLLTLSYVIDVNKPTDDGPYDFYFIRKYETADATYNTKQQFTYEILNPEVGPVLTKYKIEVEVPDSVKESYRNNDQEKYKNLYQEATYDYDFENNKVTVSSFNYLNKDGEPTVETIDYNELIIIPLYLDLGYDPADYGTFDVVANFHYNKLINMMLEDKISVHSPVLDIWDRYGLNENGNYLDIR